MKNQFLARILKKISDSMKFLQEISGSWNISIFLKEIFRKFKEILVFEEYLIFENKEEH